MLVEAFDVSGDTVRRDLQYLHQPRCGPVLMGGSSGDFPVHPPFVSRTGANKDAKAAIGAAARPNVVSDRRL